MVLKLSVCRYVVIVKLYNVSSSEGYLGKHVLCVHVCSSVPLSVFHCREVVIDNRIDWAFLKASTQIIRSCAAFVVSNFDLSRIRGKSGSYMIWTLDCFKWTFYKNSSWCVEGPVWTNGKWSQQLSVDSYLRHDVVYLMTPKNLASISNLWGKNWRWAAVFVEFYGKRNALRLPLC